MSAIPALSPHNSESDPTVYPYIENSVRNRATHHVNRGTRLLNIPRWCFAVPSLFEVTSSEGGNLERTTLENIGGGHAPYPVAGVPPEVARGECYEDWK